MNIIGQRMEIGNVEISTEKRGIVETICFFHETYDNVKREIEYFSERKDDCHNLVQGEVAKTYAKLEENLRIKGEMIKGQYNTLVNMLEEYNDTLLRNENIASRIWNV